MDNVNQLIDQLSRGGIGLIIVLPNFPTFLYALKDKVGISK